MSASVSGPRPRAALVLFASVALGALPARASSPTPLPTLVATPTALRTLVATPTPAAQPPPAFGRVVYRASKAGSYESLGVPVIACRHRDPGPRTIAVEFFDPLGKKVVTFGPTTLPNVKPGKKIVFVSEASHFPDRDVIDARVGHFGGGTARIISDARIIHCMARMRFDPGARAPTYWRSMGLYREGVGATPVPVDW